MSGYDDWIASSAPSSPGRRCSICSNPECAADVLRFVEDVQSGKVNISVHQFWSQYLRPRYGIKAVNTVWNHLRDHLGVELSRHA